MDILEQLARLSGGHQWGGVGRSTTDRLMPGEIAAWFAGCDPFGTDLLFARYGFDGIAYGSALDEWTGRVAAEYHGVPVVVYQWQWLAKGTLVDWLIGDLCRACNGKGWKIVDDKATQCVACEGRMHKSKSQREKLKIIGAGAYGSMAKRQRWENRYNWGYAQLDTIARATAEAALKAAKHVSPIYATETV